MVAPGLRVVTCERREWRFQFRFRKFRKVFCKVSRLQSARSSGRSDQRSLRGNKYGGRLRMRVARREHGAGGRVVAVARRLCVRIGIARACRAWRVHVAWCSGCVGSIWPWHGISEAARQGVAVPAAATSPSVVRTLASLGMVISRRAGRARTCRACRSRRPTTTRLLGVRPTGLRRQLEPNFPGGAGKSTRLLATMLPVSS